MSRRVRVWFPAVPDGDPITVPGLGLFANGEERDVDENTVALYESGGFRLSTSNTTVIGDGAVTDLPRGYISSADANAQPAAVVSTADEGMATLPTEPFETPPPEGEPPPLPEEGP